jgi:hypothetical protein
MIALYALAVLIRCLALYCLQWKRYLSVINLTRPENDMSELYPTGSFHDNIVARLDFKRPYPEIIYFARFFETDANNRLQCIPSCRNSSSWKNYRF